MAGHGSAVSLPEYGLKAGDIGTVVDIRPEEITLEFFTLDGQTFAVVPASPTQLRQVGQHEIAHAKALN